MAKREKIFRNISEKTKERGKGLRVMEMENGMFAVASHSKPSAGHLISNQDGYKCDCIGFSLHGDCSHIVAVQTFLANKQMV